MYGNVLTPIAIPTKTGYIFQGYFAGKNGTGTQYYNSDGTPCNNKTMDIANNTTTLYAYWTAKTDCVLTFNANGGTVSPTSRNQTFDAPLGDLPIPTRQGYIFTGWYTQASRGSEVTSSTIMKSESMTIYAHWAETWAAEGNYSDVLNYDNTDGYYILSTSQDLARVIYLLNYTTRTDVLTMKFKLTNHIDMSAYYWLPIGTESRPFGGVIDGQGYTIKGLHTISQSERRDNGGDNSGFIGVAMSYAEKTSTGEIVTATIKNIYFEDIQINGKDKVGAVIGYVIGSNETNVNNIAAVGQLNHEGTNCGALIGSSSKSKIENCLVILDGVRAAANSLIYTGSATVTNVLYDISGLRGYSSGSFEGWGYVKGLEYPLPSNLAWIANGNTLGNDVLKLWSAKNMIEYGNMEGTGWHVNNGNVLYSTEEVYEGDYSIKLIGNKDAAEITVTTAYSYHLNADHIYYASIFVKTDIKDNVRVGLYWPVDEPSMGPLEITVTNEWRMYSWRVGRDAFTSGEYPLRVDFDNNNKNGVMYIDNLILFDLTEIFGAGNEPDKAWLDDKISMISHDGISLDQYKLYSATNLIEYGDMEGEGWQVNNENILYSTEEVYEGDYSIKLIGNENKAEITVTTVDNYHLYADHVYYVTVYAYLQTPRINESIECYWPVAEPTMGLNFVENSNEWRMYSWRVTRDSFVDGDYPIRLDLNCNNNSSVLYFDNLCIIDLTATFGAGNEPDKAWLDQCVQFIATT